MVSELEGKVLAVEISDSPNHDRDVRRCTVTVLIDSGSELFMSNGFVKDQETWRLCSTDETVGARVKVRYTTSPKKDNPEEMYYNIQAMKIIEAADPANTPERPIEAQRGPSRRSSGSTNDSIEYQVALKETAIYFEIDKKYELGLFDTPQDAARMVKELSRILKEEEEWTEL